MSALLHTYAHMYLLELYYLSSDRKVKFPTIARRLTIPMAIRKALTI